MKLFFDLAEIMTESTLNQRVQNLSKKIQETLSELHVTTGSYLANRMYLTTGVRPEDKAPQIKDLANKYESERLEDDLEQLHIRCMRNHDTYLSKIYTTMVFQYLAHKGYIPLSYILLDNESGMVSETVYEMWMNLTEVLSISTICPYVSAFGLSETRIPNHDKTVINFFLVCKNHVDHIAILTRLEEYGGACKIIRDMIEVEYLQLHEETDFQRILVKHPNEVLFLFQKLPDYGSGDATTFRFTRKFKETIPSYGLELSVDKSSVIDRVDGDSLTITNDTSQFLTATALSGSVIRVKIHTQTNHIPYLIVVDGQSFPMAAPELALKGISYTKLPEDITPQINTNTITDYTLAKYRYNAWELLITNFSSSMSIHVETCEDATMKRPIAIISKQSTLSIREDLVAINLQTLFPLIWINSKAIHITAIKHGTDCEAPIKEEVEEFDISVNKFMYTENCITTTLPYPQEPPTHDCPHHPSYPDDYHKCNHDKPSRRNNPWTPDFPGRMNPNPTVKYDPPVGFNCIKMHPYSPSNKYVSFHIATCSGIAILFEGYANFDKFIITFDSYAVAVNLNASDRGQRVPHIVVPAVKPCKFTMVNQEPEDPIIPLVEDYPVDTEPGDKDDDSEDNTDPDDDNTVDSTPSNLQTKVVLAGKLSYVEGASVAIIRTVDNVNRMIRLKAPLPNRYSGELLVYDDTVEAKLIQIGSVSAVVATFKDGKEVTEWVDENADTEFPIVTMGKLLYFPATSIIVVTEVDGVKVTTNNFYLKNPLPTKPDGSSVLDTETTGKVIVIGSRQAVIITNGCGEEFFEWITNPIDAGMYHLIERWDIIKYWYIPDDESSVRNSIYAEYGSSPQYSMVLDNVQPVIGLDSNKTPQSIETLEDVIEFLTEGGLQVSAVDLCSDKEDRLHAIFYNNASLCVDTIIDDVYTGPCTYIGIFTETPITEPNNYTIVAKVVAENAVKSVKFDLPYRSDFTKFTENVVPHIEWARMYSIRTTGMTHRQCKDWVVVLPVTIMVMRAFIAQICVFEYTRTVTIRNQYAYNVSSTFISTLGDRLFFVQTGENDEDADFCILACDVASDITRSWIARDLPRVNWVFITTPIDGVRYMYLKDMQDTRSDLICSMRIPEDLSTIFRYNTKGYAFGNQLLKLQPAGPAFYACVIEGDETNAEDTLSRIPECILTPDCETAENLVDLLRVTDDPEFYVYYAYETNQSTNGIMLVSMAGTSRVLIDQAHVIPLSISGTKAPTVLDTKVIRSVIDRSAKLMYLEYTGTNGSTKALVIHIDETGGVTYPEVPISWIQCWESGTHEMETGLCIYALSYDSGVSIFTDDTTNTIIHDPLTVEFGVCTNMTYDTSSEGQVLHLTFEDNLRVNVKLDTEDSYEQTLKELRDSFTRVNLTAFLLEDDIEVPINSDGCSKFICLQVDGGITGYIFKVKEILDMYKPEEVMARVEEHRRSTTVEREDTLNVNL